MENVRVYEIPACRMVSSGCGMFGDGPLELFERWMEAQPKTLFPRDFLWFDKSRNGFVWYYIYSDGMDIPDALHLADFPGGLYAVATGVDGQPKTEVTLAVSAFIVKTGCFELDTTREELGNIVTSKAAYSALGYHQMDYYTPIRVSQ